MELFYVLETKALSAEEYGVEILGNIRYQLELNL